MTSTVEPDLRLSQLRELEAESLHVMREVAAEFERPVLLFSGGKDSIVLLRLAERAFAPAPIPFPVMHIDTGHNFPEVIEFRDRRAQELGVELIVASVQDPIDAGRATEESGPRATRNRLQTVTLLDAIRERRFDAAFGGARRDEERARAKDRVFSTARDSGSRAHGARSCGTCSTPRSRPVSTCACSRSPTGPSSTSGATSARKGSSCRRSTSPTSARCSSATLVVHPLEEAVEAAVARLLERLG
jgi:3'-phosphoadenosine 5'-phosphosulfate sulfotransferase (PAPS reductase)/FAD synthetase